MVREKGNDNDTPGRLFFTVVGLGASAGGLDALTRFFVNIAADSGMAFVVVQHLDPTRESALADLIKRYTSMRVLQVEDGMKVQPDCVYVIPPNRDMALLQGAFVLLEPSRPRSQRFPIDFFFRSLAQEQQARAIGIVLSGTGTDGTQGLQAIKDQGGMTMVQDPLSARHEGMPQSAISAGLADYILPPDRMSVLLQGYGDGRFSKSRLEESISSGSPKGDYLPKIFVVLRAQTGRDFSLYKSNAIIRGIKRRMEANRIDTIGHYLRYLQQDTSEAEALTRDVLVKVTGFFRDPEAFEALKKKIILPLLANRSLDQPLRIWVPGCSTGEEAYSIAMLVQERMDGLNQEFKVQVFATDLDNEVIKTARLGNYPLSISDDVPVELLQRFFRKEGDTYRVRKTIRNMLIFATQNVLTDPPFSKMDLISCRNLLIYLRPELQKKLLPFFHYSLSRNGFLFLGTSESIGDFTDLFAVVDRKWKLFRRKEAPYVHMQTPHLPVWSLAASTAVRKVRELNDVSKYRFRDLAEKILLDLFAPAGVVIDEQGTILYIHGQTGHYLEPAAGEASLNIVAMARQGLRLDLSNAIRRARSGKEVVRRDGIRIKTNGEFRYFNLIVTPLPESASLSGLLMVIFEEAVVPEVARSAGSPKSFEKNGRKVAELERELRSTKEYVQAITQELETAKEEFRATNEDLQSANEELVTATEELQSVNEELVTLNSQLENKVDELSRTNNDMINLLAGTEIGTIFLDENLRIQRFTPAATRVVSLIPTDVGRPLADIVIHLDYDDLLRDVEDVFDTLVPRESEVRAEDGQWYLVRILPYRTTENVIEGSMITFENITKRKQAEEAVRVSHEELNQIFNTAADGMRVISREFEILRVNDTFATLTGLNREELVGKKCYETFLGPLCHTKDCPLTRILSGEKRLEFEVEKERLDGSKIPCIVTATPYRGPNGQLLGIIEDFKDVTELKQVGEVFLRANQLFEVLCAWNGALTTTISKQQLLGEMCRLLVEKSSYLMAHAMMIKNGAGMAPKAGTHVGFVRGKGRLTDLPSDEIEQEHSPIWNVIRTGQIVVMRRIHSNSFWLPLRAEASSYGYASSVALPIMRGDKVIGVLRVCAVDMDAFDDREVLLLQKLTNALSVGFRILFSEGSNK